jgi:hypothetical protein
MYFSFSWSYTFRISTHKSTSGNSTHVTYILPDNRTKARAPQYALAGNFIHKQAFAAEHGLADALALILGHDALCAREERVFTDAPLLVAAELDDGDVADGSGREEKLAGTCVLRLGHVAADKGFFEGEFHGAFKGNGWGHGDHGAWEALVSCTELII